MKCSSPIIIFNTDLFFPSHGENKIDLSYNDGNLNVNIYYDSKESNEECTINFLFKHTCFHRLTNFPGVSDSLINFEKYEKIDSLIEFKNSDYKLQWEKHFNNLFKFRHFRIFFINANHYLEVISADLIIKK
ncbi:hypothetical protein AEQU3_02267 [Aequorivita antarctica]|nr:hypothetical protein AEQU3_02267 [Aequorivita antarctica]